MNAKVQKGDVIRQGMWVEEGNTFCLQKNNNATVCGSLFVHWLKVRGNHLSEQARVILLRDIVKISVQSIKFRILKGSIMPSGKRNMNTVLNKKAVISGLRTPDSTAVRLFFETVRASDMKEMGFKNILLPGEEKIRGGEICRLFVRKQEGSVFIGTYIEEKKDRWNDDTGFLFVE